MTKVPGQPFAKSGMTLHSKPDEQVFIFGGTPHGWLGALSLQGQWYIFSIRTRARKHCLCFSYCYIALRNILVDDDCKPVGLIDRGCAVWMPEYWDLKATIA